MPEEMKRSWGRVTLDYKDGDLVV